MSPSLGLICRMSPSGYDFKCFMMDGQMGGGCEGILCVAGILLCEGALLPSTSEASVTHGPVT